MNNQLQVVCLSVDENKAYYEHLPLVVQAWKKFFPNVIIHLGVISDRQEWDPVIMSITRHVDRFTIFPTVPAVPSANTAKMGRYFVASEYTDMICLIHDVDSAPLQKAYWDKLLEDYEYGKLLAVGADVYFGTQHEGKFPASSMMATGDIFKRLINPKNASYYDLFREWANMRSFDDKENIMNPRSLFSDESLIRALVHKNLGKDNVKHRDRDINTATQWIDRSNWSVDEVALKNGLYIEVNLPRSFDNNIVPCDITKITHYLRS